MPLPAALAAKLSKRGIIGQSKTGEKENKQEIKVAVACPNKYNIYHECTTWCQMHWKVHPTPEPRYMKNMKKLLEKYPLPKNCSELYDSGIGRYYYWDIEKNLVSWLPPSHPKAVQSESASKLRARLNNLPEVEIETQSHKISDRKKDKYKRDRDEDRRHKHDDRNRKKSKRNDLDPMDPASYSDIPRGTWSDGLNNDKNTADSTAPGAVFQQRPYPSPGDVLESNKQSKSKKR